MKYRSDIKIKFQKNNHLPIVNPNNIDAILHSIYSSLFLVQIPINLKLRSPIK